MGDDPGLSGWPELITRLLAGSRGRREKAPERRRHEKDWAGAAGFEGGRGAMSLGMWAASGSCKRRGNGVSLRDSRRNAVLSTSWFYLRPMSDVRFLELYDDKVCCFKPLSVGPFVTAATGNGCK